MENVCVLICRPELKSQKLSNYLGSLKLFGHMLEALKLSCTAPLSLVSGVEEKGVCLKLVAASTMKSATQLPVTTSYDE